MPTTIPAIAITRLAAISEIGRVPVFGRVHARPFSFFLDGSVRTHFGRTLTRGRLCVPRVFRCWFIGRLGVFDRRHRLTGRRCRQCSYGRFARKRVATAAVGASTTPVGARAWRDRAGANGRKRDFRDRPAGLGAAGRFHRVGSSRRRIERNMCDRALSSHLLGGNGMEKTGYDVVTRDRTNDPDRKAADRKRYGIARRGRACSGQSE